MFARSLTKAVSGAFAGMLFMAASNAGAVEFREFTLDAFAAAQADGTPFVVDVYADWCPTCRAQHRAIEQLAGDPRFDGVVVLVIDYDTERNFMRLVGAPARSILIAFEGSEEIGRVNGSTRFEDIQALFVAAVE